MPKFDLEVLVDTDTNSATVTSFKPHDTVPPVVVDPPPVPTPPAANKFYLGTQTGYVASWSGAKVYKDNVNWATAYASGDNIWNPAYLADLVGYGCMRHMDSNSVNFSKITSWSQRKQPNDPKNAEIYIDANSPASQTGMAVEWQIDLCNKTNTNCWLTHPYLADDDYIRQQALLAKAKLKPGLVLFIELSNEVWNGGFSAFQQSIAAAQKGGLPGTNQWYQGIAHEMYRALQMYQIYSDVFGAAAMGTSVVRVFSESGNLDLTTQALNNVYQSPKWNPHAQQIDMIAIAPYVGAGWDGAAFNMSQWKSDILAKVAGEPIAQAKAHMKAHGITRLGSYEFGQSFYKGSDAFAKNPLAYDAYTFMLDQWSAAMNDVANHYHSHGVWGPSAFGAYDHVGQDISQAPKARALRDWIKRHKA